MVPGNGVCDCCGWITCAEYWSSPGDLSSSDSHVRLGTGPISCHSHSEQVCREYSYMYVYRVHDATKHLVYTG